jgi:S1-C subfamily serine protease
VSEASRSSYPSTAPELPPLGHRPSPIPPRRGRNPAHLLIIAVIAALLLGATTGVGRTMWYVSASLLSSPWAQSGALPLARWSSKSSGPVNVSAPDAGVVDINSQLGYQNAVSAGTGIVLSPSGEVLTNNHVISGATSISITDVATRRSYPATVVGYDPSHDIALLQAQGASSLTTASIGDSSTVEVGDEIAAVGNAGGVGGPPTIAPGTVSALDRTIIASDGNGSAQQLSGLIQVAANMQPGDSGGPLVNIAGQVVGINTAASTGFRFESASDEGYAIPINDVIAIAKQIQAGSSSSTVHIGPTGILGIVVEDTRSRAGLSPWGRSGSRYGSAVPGATVVGVLPGSPGDQAQLAAGDTIVAFDHTAIDSATTLTTMLNSHHPGDSVQLTWLDPSGQQHDATVRLVAGPPN